MPLILTTPFKTPPGISIASPSFVQSFSVNPPESQPQDVTFDPTGTRMYVIGFNTDTVYHYDLSTAWDISTASFGSPTDSFSVAAQTGLPKGVAFRPNGTKMVVTDSNAARIYSYDLSIAWNVASATFDTFLFIGNDPQGLEFSGDGTKLYVLRGQVSFQAIREYTLSTPWDLSTASFVQSLDVSTEITQPYGLTITPDGTQAFVCGTLSNGVYRYDLSTAWDISSGVFIESFDPSTQDDTPTDVTFKPDGSKMYIIGDQNNSVYEYNV